MDLHRQAARGAEAIHRAFDAHHRRFREVTRRVLERFGRRDWAGIRADTVARLELHGGAVGAALDELHGVLGGRIGEVAAWSAMKEAYAHAVVGRDDFELAQTFFNSLSRRVFSHSGVDPAIDFTADDFPLPYKGWEMASARMYAVRRVDAATVRRVLEDAGFGVPFADLEGDARRAAERVAAGIERAFGGAAIEALDVLRPVFVRNKGAYLVGRARRGGSLLPVVLAVLHQPEGLVVDAVLTTEDETSILFSFARWYFHAAAGSPRELIGFLASLLPRKRISELYVSLGYTKHGKTELYRDLMGHLARSMDRFEHAAGDVGMVMIVFTLRSFDYVFKIIRDRFAPPKTTTRDKVRERYQLVFEHDRAGRLIEAQEFESLSFDRWRFAPELLDELLTGAARNVELEGERVTLRHVYVERRVEPLNLFLRRAPRESALRAVHEYGQALRDLARTNIFPGDLLLKNFGVTRHGRVTFYDYDELCLVTECRFRDLPDDEDGLSAEPGFYVGERDVFPEEFLSFLGLVGEQRAAFLADHAEILTSAFWRDLKRRHEAGEVIDVFPYPPGRSLGARATGTGPETPPSPSGPAERTPGASD
jgi:isocitrate dehydrogenase kinase/phosphatase